ncbi:hypothetical protein TRFO_06185 [Tritrichomonas foetus]|uniref:Uncharacterized protein n=1 Tax=Tritrichomonas foetus TaxID=1144522 RepID=A0A1J4K009_9EUKA|nr:hypothetical protein TRFO_06185 [Tritrichomonas foetus]|eukprot:OHT04751.1 hypothetical protein TRFO_06185 [Tritrichomonas foetus]
MESNKLNWLRGPLPPIADSILMSGLVNEAPHSYVASNTTNNQKLVFQSAPVSVSKPPKRPLKLASFPKPRIDSALKPYKQPVIPIPEINASYKPPPLEEATLTFKKQNIPNLHKENLTEKVLLPKQSNVRDFLANLKHELDANIASIIPISPEMISPEQQNEIQSQLLQFYNYAFNQIILNEKSVSVDKAVMLRRIMKFYNQILSDFPPIFDALENEKISLEEELNALKEEIESKNKNIEKQNEKISELEKNTQSIKETLEKTIEESNKKDIAINSTTFDLDLSKSQLNQLQFRFNQEKEVNQSLKNVLEQRDKEIKGQLEQIEGLTQKIAEFQSGETGYIVFYHEEKAKNEELNKVIEDLKQKIYELENIEKSSIAVDTSDLPVKKGRKKKIKENNSFVPSQESEATSIPSNPSNSLLNGHFTGHSNPSSVNNSFNMNVNGAYNKPNKQINSQLSSNKLNKSLSKNKIISSQVSTNSSLAFMPTQETQTEYSLPINKLSISDQSVEFSIYGNNFVVNPSLASFGSFESSNPNLITKNLSNFSFSDDYNIKEKLESTPDLHKFVMPLFSDIYIPPSSSSLKVLNIGKVNNIVKSEKPLVWGLQLIHNFLTDPYIRSIENKTRISNEVIIVDWIAQKYKVRHLINQALADFVHIITRYQGINEMISLFIEVIEGNFNLAQLCFLATVYSFSCSLTYPDLIKEYSTFDSSDCHGDAKIHICAVHKMYATCFSNEIANAVTRSISEDMLNYVTFLKNITIFFGDKHRLISNQARDLLSLCGCMDPRIILYDVFESVCIILGNTTNIKEDWKLVINRTGDRNATNITLSDLLVICAEREKPLMNLLNIIPLGNSVQIMKNMSQNIYELYHEFINRYSRILPHVMSLISSQIRDKVLDLTEELKEAILHVDMPKIIWVYRVLISKIDRLTMKEKGFIPFNIRSSVEVIGQLKEYIDRAESVAFALLE